ncbi:MAG: ribosome biogenesis GTP-binding protein YihA/YsxC [Chitinispirillia bacterium]
MKYTYNKDKADQKNLIFPKARYFHSAGCINEFPDITGAEYCLLGRSNVGKSSFINHVLGNKTLAYVSKKPGKTRLANFFYIDDSITWVDLPGYGYAKASQSEIARCSRLIIDYCTKRKNLAGIIWLLDIRHIGVKVDLKAFEWLQRFNHPVFPVITKIDKLSQNKRVKQIREIENYYNLNPHACIYSIHKSSCRDRFWYAFRSWTQNIIY